MSTIPLPTGPSLDQLRKQAKELRGAVRAAEPAALDQVAAHHPGGVPADPATFRLATAQLVLARRHGFASWARLKRHVELLTRYTRTPDRRPTSGRAADEFLYLACLVYDGEDGPARWAGARELLGRHPELREGSIHVAAALADAERIRALLAGDPGLADRQGGPHRWEPLLYLAYSRIDPDVTGDAVLTSARLLLDAGADPNAGFFHHGLPSPFTVLTGAFGEGEAGPVRQPRHPHSLALARLLLDAGADPNDSQALYNRMFQPGDDHLELLFTFGLGRDTGGPWRARLGDAQHPPIDAIPSPRELLADQLRWAVELGHPERVRLLIGHGVDVTEPLPDGRPPAELAALRGHRDIVRLLVAAGAAAPELDRPQALLAAALAGDEAEVRRLVATDPGLPEAARAHRPAAILDAAATGNADAVRLLAGLGFDVNARDRITALHEAAASGEVELVRLLLSLGADPAARDTEFDATPLEWAHHEFQDEAAAVLADVSQG